MIIIWQDPAWLQQQSFTVPLIHFKDRSKESAAGHLFSEVQSVWQHVEQCARGVAQATVEFQKARDTLAAATDWQQRTPWYKQVEDAVETKEGLLEKALLQEEEVKSAWAMLKPFINEAGFYVWSSSGKGVKILEPALRPKDMSMKLLKSMLAEACMGM
jgi:hypothetical protein